MKWYQCARPAWFTVPLSHACSPVCDVVCASHEKGLFRFDLSSDRERWFQHTGGKVMALASLDPQSAGSPCLFAACADGCLMALSQEGAICWTLPLSYPLYDVAVFQSGPQPLLVCGGMDHCLTVVSLSGQILAQHPVDAVVQCLAPCPDGFILVENMQHLERYRYGSRSIELVWHKVMEADGSATSWENNTHLFYASSLSTTLDDRGELLIALGSSFSNRQAVQIRKGDGDIIVTSSCLSSDGGMGVAGDFEKNYDFYFGAFVCWGRLEGSPVVYSLSSGNLRCLSAHGEELWSHEAKIGFSGVTLLNDRELLLSSCPIGDNCLYQLDLSGDLERQFDEFCWQGKAAEIASHAAAALEKVKALASVDLSSRPPIALHLGFWVTEELDERQVHSMLQQWLNEQAGEGCFQLGYGMSNLVERDLPERHPELIAFPWRMENEIESFGKDTETILELAKVAEDGGRPFSLRIAHSCQPVLSLETIEELFKRCPLCLSSVVSLEEENPDHYEVFYESFMRPLAELCNRYNKNLISHNKSVFWLAAPALPGVYSTISQCENWVASAEDSNSRSSELNLMGRIGLRQLGLVKNSIACFMSDLHRLKYSDRALNKQGHGALRSLLCQWVLGCTEIHLRSFFLYLKEGRIEYTRFGKESLEILLHLFRGGLLYPVPPEDGVGFSRMGIVMHQPDRDWLAEADSLHRPHHWFERPYPKEALMPFNGCTWSWAPTPLHSLSSVLFCKKTQGCSHIPATPYGAVIMVPEHAPYQSDDRVDEWLHTDGVFLWQEQGGERFCGNEAGAILRERAEFHAGKLPVRAFGDDVFCHTISPEENRMRVFLMDPDWFNPGDCKINLVLQCGGDWKLLDALTGEALAASFQSCELTVPAGSFRILEVIRA